MVKALRNI